MIKFMHKNSPCTADMCIKWYWN